MTTKPIPERLLIGTARYAATSREEQSRKDAIEKKGEFLISVLENLPYPFYVIDASDYAICVTNSARAQLTDSTARITCYALLHKRNKPCSLDGYSCAIEKVKETAEPFRMEASCRDPENEGDRVFEIHAFPIFREGRISHIVEHCVDVTERRQAEVTLKASESKLVELSNELLETNRALAVMARNLDRNREEVEKSVARAISSRIVPLIRDLEHDRRFKGGATELGMVAAYLRDIVENLTKGTAINAFLSSTETRVAVMAKNGMKSHEIADHLHISLETVKTHRKNIRKKLGIQNSHMNLFSYLSSELSGRE